MINGKPQCKRLSFTLRFAVNCVLKGRMCEDLWYIVHGSYGLRYHFLYCFREMSLFENVHLCLDVFGGVLR